MLAISISRIFQQSKADSLHKMCGHISTFDDLIVLLDLVQCHGKKPRKAFVIWDMSFLKVFVYTTMLVFKIHKI